jgi:hypothetical protein
MPSGIQRGGIDDNRHINNLSPEEIASKHLKRLGNLQQGSHSDPYSSITDKVVSSDHNPITFIENGIKGIIREVKETGQLAKDHPKIPIAAAGVYLAVDAAERGSLDKLRDKVATLDITKQEKEALLAEIEKAEKPDHETLLKIMNKLPTAIKLGSLTTAMILSAAGSPWAILCYMFTVACFGMDRK